MIKNRTGLPMVVDRTFPNAYFVDPAFFRAAQMSLPQVEMPLPSIVLNIARDSSRIAAEFFSSVHGWLPIISKQKLLRDLQSPVPMSSQRLVLYFCMDLIARVPQDTGMKPYPLSDQYPVPEVVGEPPMLSRITTPSERRLDGTARNPRSEEYFAVKSVFQDAEHTGILSIEHLQALVLVTVYELGHGIYPAAYFSISTCVRYGMTLGIDKQRVQDIAFSSYDFEELEERRRIWWVIYILDRLVVPT